jgi:hypothetical protein
VEQDPLDDEVPNWFMASRDKYVESFNEKIDTLSKERAKENRIERTKRVISTLQKSIEIISNSTDEEFVKWRQEHIIKKREGGIDVSDDVPPETRLAAISYFEERIKIFKSRLEEIEKLESIDEPAITKLQKVNINIDESNKSKIVADLMKKLKEKGV